MVAMKRVGFCSMTVCIMHVYDMLTLIHLLVNPETTATVFVLDLVPTIDAYCVQVSWKTDKDSQSVAV